MGSAVGYDWAIDLAYTSMANSNYCMVGHGEDRDRATKKRVGRMFATGAMTSG
ncbi:hypothetical protein HMPREF0724_12199 [Prescottella equi ATCC 33707]|uniref:Uncharacterized protein n=1 Tax=Prescottella equi ATCC 33707 TaxID=525370 RepID=E9T0P0_RHOHA|nr:hypothetical protein HMPREF0724_12199 [Prescottella equi ATCC 33707]